MSIASELTRIQTAKADIKTAIEAKGVTVPSSATIDTYDDYITSIPSGGGGSDETLKGLIQRTITSLVIPSGVTVIGNNAFRNCGSLTAVTIPSGVIRLDSESFRDCIGLTSVIIPSGVTSIGNSAFESCTSLTSIDIPDSVTSISTYAFQSCSDLTSVTIPDSVTSIGNAAFNGCRSLTSVTIPSGVTSIGNAAFYGCSGLASITVNAATPPTLVNVNAFSNTNDCPIYVPAASLTDYQSAWSNLSSRIQAIGGGENPNSGSNPNIGGIDDEDLPPDN